MLSAKNMKPLFVVKPSKIEWDAYNSGKSREEIIDGYKRDGANWQVIMDSDFRQQEVRRGFVSAFYPDLEMVSLSEFVKTHKQLLETGKFDVVISLGGDNSFTRVSHFLEDVPILGITSDPINSVGALNSEKANIETILKVKRCLAGGNFYFEEWTRIECELNGKKQLPFATSEIFLGERLRKNMSRHILTDRKGNSREQKCSGLLVCSGAGSTGWFNSCSEYLPYKPTEREIRYVVTELFRKQRTEHPDDELLEGEEISVTSLNDDGIISIDSWEEKPFNRGAVAKIRAGKPLKVMKLK